MKGLASGSEGGITVEQAYARCALLAQTHYENFTVGSWLLPRDKRPHMYAIYAYCRGVDDLGDEYEGNRMDAIDAWEEDLERCYDGTPSHPFMVALQQTIRDFDIPIEPFRMLVKANRMDQTVTRHQTYDDLERYCQHSANPVGHLVLYLFGYRDEERQALSDHTCTALQLTNFWQDVARDYEMGRVYLPVEDMERFGYTEDMLSAGEFNSQFGDMMAFEVERARDLFRRGLALVDTLDGRLKLDVTLFSCGGSRILDAIQKQGYDVLGRRPTISKAARAWLMLSTTVRLRLGLGV